MKNIPIENIRNVVFMGHTGSGKTTLVDALLHKLGINDRLGSPASGSSMADYTDLEKTRRISVFGKAFSAVYKTDSGKEMGLVFGDTPGYMDFFGATIAAARAADAGLIVIDAASGIQVGTHRAVRCCSNRGLDTKGIVITGLDKDNTDFAATLAEIRAAFGSGCVPVVLPTSDGGVIDVLAAKNIPADLEEQLNEIKGGLVELAAETDDTMIEKYLNGEDLSPEEIGAGLVEAVASGGFTPVFVTMAPSETGITELLNGICRLFPSPASHAAKDVDGNRIDPSAEAPFAGLVFRSVNDAFVGQLTFVRVLGGTLRADSEIYNASRDHKERFGNLLEINGKKQAQIPNATAGDIVAIPKLKNTHVGDSLCAIGSKIIAPPIRFPNPVMLQAVTAKTQADEDKLGVALQRVTEEDPTLLVERNTETHETVLKGLGDVHMDVAVEMMRSRSNVNVELHTPKVAYRETVTGTGEGHHKHKKQSGGRGQYGEVYLRVEPKMPDEEDWFVDGIVGGVIPGNFLPAIQKGLVEGMQKGAVAGYPVTNVKVTVYDGSYHDVDSSEVAFKIAGSRALRDGMRNARPVLLEPIMTVKVMIPDDCMGDANGDLNHKRGRILGIGNEDGMQVITAEVPQAELFRYAAELRSITGGRGSFETTFERYDTVPANVAQKIVDATKHEEDEE